MTEINKRLPSSAVIWSACLRRGDRWAQISAHLSTNYHMRSSHWILLNPLIPREISAPSPAPLGPFRMTSTGGQLHRREFKKTDSNSKVCPEERSSWENTHSLDLWTDYFIEGTWRSHKKLHDFYLSNIIMPREKSFLNGRPPLLPRSTRGPDIFHLSNQAPNSGRANSAWKKHLIRIQFLSTFETGRKM